VTIVQFVRLLSKGELVKMSKRAGEFITLDDLIAEVGADCAKFFFLMRSTSSHLDFDMDLAKSQNAENPVYYVQYAHARVASLLRSPPRGPGPPAGAGRRRPPRCCARSASCCAIAHFRSSRRRGRPRSRTA
jgi:arginyl-tRNA synthetase